MKKKSAEEIIKIGRTLFQSLTECRLCPMDCGVNRPQGELGKCRSTAEFKIASHNLHFGEEPPLSGGGGSGTIFLSNCSLCCRYCQNYPISQFGNGRVVSIGEFVEMMLKLQARGAENINFVTPDHMLPMILLGVGEAMKEGLKIPLVYNCSGYQKLEILKHLEGIIDVYLVDMRYDDDALARHYSGCERYVEVNRAAVREMYRQVGNLKMDGRKMARSGIIIRHLVLPNNISGSKGIFKFLAEEISGNVYISLMSQYFPAYRAVNDETINRRVTVEEFDRAVEGFYEAGLKNGFIQNLSYESSY
nr:radical SAM protein [candidate division Zixibacteria bacterium]